MKIISKFEPAKDGLYSCSPVFHFSKKDGKVMSCDNSSKENALFEFFERRLLLHQKYGTKLGLFETSNYALSHEFGSSL